MIIKIKTHIDFLREHVVYGDENYWVCFILSIISNSTVFNVLISS